MDCVRSVPEVRQFIVRITRFTGAEVARCPVASSDMVDKAVKSSLKAQKDWADKTPLERGKILKKAAEICRVSFYLFFSIPLTVSLSPSISLYLHFSLSLSFLTSELKQENGVISNCATRSLHFRRVKRSG